MDSLRNLPYHIGNTLAQFGLGRDAVSVLSLAAEEPGLSLASLIVGALLFLVALSFPWSSTRITRALMRRGILQPHLPGSLRESGCAQSVRFLQYETDSLVFAALYAGTLMALTIAWNPLDMSFHLNEGFQLAPLNEPLFMVFNVALFVVLLALSLALARDISGFGIRGPLVTLLRFPQILIAVAIGFFFWPALIGIAALSFLGGRRDALYGLAIGPLNLIPVLFMTVTRRYGA